MIHKMPAMPSEMIKAMEEERNAILARMVPDAEIVHFSIDPGDNKVVEFSQWGLVKIERVSIESSDLSYLFLREARIGSERYFPRIYPPSLSQSEDKANYERTEQERDGIHAHIAITRFDNCPSLVPASTGAAMTFENRGQEVIVGTLTINRRVIP